MKKYTLILFACLKISLLSFGQSKLDSLLNKMNELHKSSQYFEGKVATIYIDTQKAISIDGVLIPWKQYTVKYESYYNSADKKQMDGIKFSCTSLHNCMINNKSGDSSSGLWLFYKSKNACEDFLVLLNEINTELNSAN